MRQPCQENPLRGKVHRAELDVCLQKESIRVERHLEELRQSRIGRLRFDPGTEHQPIGSQGDEIVSRLNSNAHFQPAALIQDRGLICLVVFKENDACPASIAVKMLAESITAQVTVEDDHLRVRRCLFDYEGVLEGLCTANP